METRRIQPESLATTDTANPLAVPEVSDEDLREILRCSIKIAVVGLSPKAERDSHRVARYLLEQGYEVIPVNPGQKEILGRTCYKSLGEIPYPLDIVDVFVNPERVPQVAEQAVHIHASVLWLQLGVIHHEAAMKAFNAKVKVVMDRCIMIEHRRLGPGIKGE